MNALRRLSAHAGSYLLLAVLALTAAAAVVGVPRLSGTMATDGLRQYVADRPGVEQEIVFSQSGFRVGGWGQPTEDADRLRRVGPDRLDELREAMPPRLRSLVEGNWYHYSLPPAAAEVEASFALVAIGGVTEAAELVAGAWPAETAPPFNTTGDPLAPLFARPAEIALSAAVADGLGLTVGSRFLVSAGGDVPVVVAGIFTPYDPDAGIWDINANPLELTRIENRPSVAGAVTSEAVIDSIGSGSDRTWRYRTDPQRLDVAELDALVTDLEELRRKTAGQLDFTPGLDLPLRQFAENHRAARNLLAVIAAGVVAALAGLIGLAAASAARRRQAEYTLLRARGASAGNLLRRSLAETLLVAPPAALLGALLGLRLPGPPGNGIGWAAGVVVVLTVLPALFVLRAGSGATGRRAVLRSSGSARRLTAETALLLVAGLGTYLLLNRGLDAAAGVDPLLTAVPVLLAVAVALLVLRLYPLPMRLAQAVAARRSGAVAFLGLARAGRAPVTAPLVVVVIGVATIFLCAVLAGGIAAGRADALHRQVPADALLTGGRYAPDTAEQLAQAPGITGVAPLIRLDDQRLYADGVADLGTIDVLIVDVAAYERVTGDDLPAGLDGDPGADGPLPVLLSTSLAADLAAAEKAQVALPVGRRDLTVVGSAEVFPLLDRAQGRFVVLPWAATTSGSRVPMVPTGFLLAGEISDPDALLGVGDEGQRRFLEDRQIGDGVVSVPSGLTSRAEAGERLAKTGVNALVQFAFVAGALGGVLLALIAVAFAVLAGHRQRGKLLSRLRTMGLSRSQARGLLALEVAPLVVTAVLAGALTGVALPRVLGPVLELSAVSGGVAVPLRPHPALFAAVAALAAAGLLLAAAVETVQNRRRGLGQALRLGEES